MSENNSTLENSNLSSGDITKMQAAVANAPKNVEEVMETFENKVNEQIEKNAPLPQPRNRAERRALKFNKIKRDKLKHLDELRKDLQAEAYINALKNVKRMREKMEEKLNDSNEADMGV